MIPVFPLTVKKIHILGIGGIGMSGIAEILRTQGYHVQGSDIADGYNVQRLQASGIPVFVGHDAKHVDADVSVVVCSTDIPLHNVEVLEAKRWRIPVITRAQMLSELMRSYLTIAISGTHGKTTTTSLVAAVLESIDPTVINGGIVNAYGNNVKLGSSRWMVVEADESDATFVRVPTSVAIVTNIDPEHLNYYKTFENLKEHFRRFIQQIAFYGFAVVCQDHPVVRELIADMDDQRIITYGFDAASMARALNLKPTLQGISFDVSYEGRLIPGFFLPMMGEHNVQNALAAIVVGMKMGLSVPEIQARLKVFQGVKRRFCRVGQFQGMQVIDDYAHHPSEIKAVLKAARQATSGRVLAVFQPHRYSRFSTLFEDFVMAFEDADAVVVTPVFSGGEAVIDGLTPDVFQKAFEARNPQPIFAAEDFEGVVERLKMIGQPKDLVIFLGAGNSTKWAHDLPLTSPGEGPCLKPV